MNDKDPPHRPLREMTPDEVAQLLAEYGVSGPFDDILDIPAVSKSVFEYGGRDVFLTGTVGGTEGEEDSSNDRRKVVNAGIDHTWPLESVLMHCTDIISSSTTQPLLEEVNKILATTNTHTPPPEDVNVNDRLECSLGSDNNGILNNDGLEVCDLVRSCLRSDDDTKLLKRLDDMLEEADRIIANRKQLHADPMSEAFLIERQNAMEEEERLWSSVHSEDLSGDEEGSSGISLSTFRSIKAFGEEGREVVTKSDEERQQTLFAFEYGPTLEEEEILEEWDNALLNYEKRITSNLHLKVSEDGAMRTGGDEDILRPCASSTGAFSTEEVEERASASVLRAWEENQAVVLESISTIQARDSDLEAVAASQLTLHSQRTRQCWQRSAVSPGKLVFESFTKRVDNLLPPGELEVKIRSMVAVQGEEGGVDMEMLGKQCILSIESSRKAAERKNFRQVCEEREELNMQKEDFRATLEWRRDLEEEENKLATTMGVLMQQHKTGYEQIIEEEHELFKQLLEEKRSDASEVVELEVSRRQQAMRVVAEKVMREQDLLRSEIMKEEEELSSKIYQEARLAVEGLQSLRQKTLQQVLVALSGLRSAYDEGVDNGQFSDSRVRTAAGLMTEKSWRCFLAANKEVNESWNALRTLPDFRTGLSSSLRIQLLSEERLCGEKWLGLCNQEIKDITDLLKARIDDDTHHMRNSCLMSDSNPETAVSTSCGSVAHNTSVPSTIDTEANSDCCSDNCLDAELAKRLQPLALGGGVSNAREVAQRCYSLSFALEQISNINFSSLATLTVCCARGGATPVATFVRELDLGGNSLRQLQLDDALRVFPSLRALNVCDNKIHDIRCRVAPLRGVSEAQANSVAQSACLTRLDVSANALSNVEAVGKLLSYHLRTLSMFSNRVESLLPLAQCTRLECLQASRNMVRSLTELKQLRLLQTIDLSDNFVETIEPIAQQVLLQNLYLSRNKLRSIPSSLCLGFLRQLFLNGNALTSLPADNFCWLPLLAVVHVENNNLRDISGLAHCPRLATVHLSFNELQSIDDLRPLTACRTIETLSVHENPFFRVGTCDTDTMRRSLKGVVRQLIVWFPHLSELNNEKVSDEERRSAELDEVSHLEPYCAARQLWLSTVECGISSTFRWPQVISISSIQRFCGTMSCCNRKQGPLEVYAQLLRALSGDILLTFLQREQDHLSTIRRRKYHDAVQVEEELRKRLRDSRQNINPITQRLSDKVEEHNRLDFMRMAEAHLNRMQNASRVRGNIHIVDTLYAQRAKTFKEVRAKKYICTWMHGQFLVKKAKIQLQALRNSHQSVLKRRYDLAARTIQSLWRGAIIRSRLKRIMNLNLDNDDEKFAPVSLDFLDNTSAEFDGVGAVLQRVLETRGTEFNFEFNAPFADLKSSDTPVRSNSAGQVRISNTEKLLDPVKRPDSQPQVNLVPSSDGGDDWGALFSSQLERRQKKMERIHRENMQREFMKDPLRIKRELQKRSDSRVRSTVVITKAMRGAQTSKTEELKKDGDAIAFGLA